MVCISHDRGARIILRVSCNTWFLAAALGLSVNEERTIETIAAPPHGPHPAGMMVPGAGPYLSAAENRTTAAGTTKRLRQEGEGAAVAAGAGKWTSGVGGEGWIRGRGRGSGAAAGTTTTLETAAGTVIASAATAVSGGAIAGRGSNGMGSIPGMARRTAGPIDTVPGATHPR